jgi:hypothetical protein
MLGAPVLWSEIRMSKIFSTVVVCPTAQRGARIDGQRHRFNVLSDDAPTVSYDLACEHEGECVHAQRPSCWLNRLADQLTRRSREGGSQ